MLKFHAEQSLFPSIKLFHDVGKVIDPAFSRVPLHSFMLQSSLIVGPADNLAHSSGYEEHALPDVDSSGLLSVYGDLNLQQPSLRVDSHLDSSPRALT